MAQQRLAHWLLILGLAGSAAFGADPSSAPILNKKKPGWTNPILSPNQADKVTIAEKEIQTIEDNRDKLKTGQMKPEEFDKSLAESKQKIAEAAAEEPESAPVQTSAARAYIVAGDTEKAVAHATKAIELKPDDPFPVMTRSIARFEAKDYPKAAEDAKRALEMDPDNPAIKALYMLSKDRPAGGTIVGGAQTRVQRAIERAALPANPYAPADLGAASGKREDEPPELARYKTEQGRAFARQIISAEKAMTRRDFLTAFGLANQAMLVSPDNQRLMAARAVSAYGLGEYKTAAEDASRVLALHPFHIPMLLARAMALNDMRRHAEALADADRGIQISPTLGKLYRERAIAKEGLGDSKESALVDYKRASELDPQFTSDYLAALSRLSPQAGPSTAASSAKAVDGSGANPPTTALSFLPNFSSTAGRELYWLLAGALVVAVGTVLARRTRP